MYTPNMLAEYASEKTWTLGITSPRFCQLILDMSDHVRAWESNSEEGHFLSKVPYMLQIEKFFFSLVFL